MKTYVITGGSGFIAQELAAHYLKKRIRVILLSRLEKDGSGTNFAASSLLKTSDYPNLLYADWDGRTLSPGWTALLEGASVLINLAGATVNCRYTEKNRERLFRSRLDSTAILGEAIRHTKNPPRLWINMSSATVYADSYAGPNDELTGKISIWKNDNMPWSLLDRIRFRFRKWYRTLRYGSDHEKVKDLEKDLSVAIVQRWEDSFFSQPCPGVRKVALRTAITLGNGGVLTPYYRLLKWGLGGKQGSGNQRISWIHSTDLARIIEWVDSHASITGVLNAAAPESLTNAVFMKTLRRLTGNQFGLPAFTWMLELGTWLIGSESELILKSRWVYPRRLLDSGFQFTYPGPDKALAELVAQTPRKAYRLF